MVMVVLQAALAVTNLNVLEVMQPSLRVVQTLSIQRGGSVYEPQLTHDQSNTTLAVPD